MGGARGRMISIFIAFFTVSLASIAAGWLIGFNTFKAREDRHHDDRELTEAIRGELPLAHRRML